VRRLRVFVGERRGSLWQRVGVWTSGQALIFLTLILMMFIMKTDKRKIPFTKSEAEDRLNPQIGQGYTTISMDGCSSSEIIFIMEIMRICVKKNQNLFPFKTHHHQKMLGNGTKKS
jgi:hypothetical protein